MESKTSKISSKSFKQFPDFTKLDTENKDEYRRIVSKFPPIANISFETLKIWWDELDNAQIALLNGNLVISYWSNGGEEEQSGLCLVGENKVDESICEIFDHLKQNGQRPRLFYVPEFVVHHIKYPEMFKLKSDIRDDEYVLDISKFADVKKLPIYQRSKIKRFMQRVGQCKVEVLELDLHKPENRLKLIESANGWPKKGFNKLGTVENDAMILAIRQSSEIGTNNLCLFVDGDLQAFLIYSFLADPSYIAIHNARINYEINGMFDYMAYAFADGFGKQGVKYANLHSDLNLLHLRALKIALRPTGYIRKFAIEPLGD